MVPHFPLKNQPLFLSLFSISSRSRFRVMGRRRGTSAMFGWVRKQSTKVKGLLAVTVVMICLVSLKLMVKDHNHFFIASETTHALGILALIYKLTTQNTSSGLSLKTQELTAIFLGVRVFCSFTMEGDIHTVLDLATLVSTIWVIYMMRTKLKSTYIQKIDNMPLYYMVIPCAILSMLVYPYTAHSRIFRILWAFCVYLESVSVLPQLRLMQNAKTVEPFTAHYVFALGVARFFGCAHWIIKVYETGGKSLLLTGSGYLWLPMVLISELVQTFILADFCYYYVKSAVYGQLLDLRSPV